METKDERTIENYGYEAATKGATISNSHFSWFATPESTVIWQRGYDRGIAEKSAIPPVTGDNKGE